MPLQKITPPPSMSKAIKVPEPAKPHLHRRAACRSNCRGTELPPVITVEPHSNRKKKPIDLLLENVPLARALGRTPPTFVAPKKAFTWYKTSSTGGKLHQLATRSFLLGPQVSLLRRTPQARRCS